MLSVAATIVALGLGASVHGADIIHWKQCSPNPLIECGSFVVPLDYSDLSVGYATLALTRYKASRSPRLGSMFTNPGGPGGSGTDWVQSAGESMSNSSNGQYDIVGWDPRGINYTTPGISCGFKTPEELDAFWNDSFLGSGVEARGNFTDKRDIDYFYSQLEATDAKAIEFGQRCLRNDGGFLKYMGTASVVRDMVALSDAIEGKGKQINYWGFSYGTVIGSYFVNMFPDRVGKVIIDGVVDTVVYATQPSYKTWSSALASSEATFAGFTQACAQAGPQGCAIAQEGSTPASIAQWIRDLIDAAYDYRTPESEWTSYTVRNALFEKMYAPAQWADFAETLSQIASSFWNNYKSSSRVSGRAQEFPSVFVNGSNQVSEGINTVVIACLDSIDQEHVTMKDAFDELLRVTHEESPLFGHMMAVGAEFICHRFPMRAVERFTGPFNHKLSNPILVIGNEADPITPLASANAVAQRLGSSAYLVEQDDYGHASIAERSDCTTNVIKDYFIHGKLPEKGKFCGTNQALFPGTPITKGTMAVSLSATSDNGGTNENDDMNKLKQQRNIFLALAASFGAATLLLAVALLFTCFKNRKNKRYAPPSAAFAVKHDMTHTMEAARVEPYSDPWEGKKTVY